MLTPDLTPRTARKERRRHSATDAFVEAHERLFVLLTTLRAASAESLHALHFGKRAAPTSLRQTYRDLRQLQTLGFLERQHLSGGRAVYRLTAKGYASFPSVHRRASDAIRKPLSEALAGYCWLRSAVWAELANRGYRVGRGLDEQRALRRFLVDSQRAVVAVAKGAAREVATSVLDALRANAALTPLFRATCRRCGVAAALGEAARACPRCSARTEAVQSTQRFRCQRCAHVSDRDEPHASAAVPSRRCESAMREVDHLPFDVAWRSTGAAFEVAIVVVDDPQRSLREQLEALPLRVVGQPKVPVVLRTTDEHSVMNPVNATWLAMGERHRELLRAFSDQGDRRLFPFSLTAEVIDVRPELQLRLRPLRKEDSHA